ncbi:hypothetical protein B6I21_04460 [candidate division KSB1 bacterium 4572_119]|nr:MAG: hypothetical protein B6I21_04460 [candidate division KSB1 bacterium 4572_119]
MTTNVRRITIFLLILFGTLLVTNQTISCQEKEYPRGAQYYLGTDDQLLIKVNVWGFVAKPGQYLVPSGTDLISLISFAGGPREGARLDNIKLIRESLSSKDSQNKITKINVQKYIKQGDKSIIPHLKPGDTIVISGTKWYHLSKYLEFISKFAMLVQIYAWIVYYSDRK